MRIELLTHGKHTTRTGIGRYVHEVMKHVGELAEIDLCQLQYPPLSGRVSPLRQLPVGIDNHVPGSIVHFPQIMGCAMMLYLPYHPSVATVHDLGLLELAEEWKMSGVVARQMLRLSLAGLRRVDTIVAVSEFTRQAVIKHLGISGDRVTTIHSGIDHELFRPIANARELLLAVYPHLAAIVSAPWVIYVGSELPRKNINTLLQAVAIVREEVPDLRLLKVGSAGGGHLRRETLRVISELGLDDHVLMFEAVDEEALPLFYGAADLYATASRLEGFGFPTLEAMACGTPVVCSSAGALPEVVGDAGLLVEPGDAQGFADAIASLMRDPHLKERLQEDGLQRCRRFSWAHMAEETVAGYEEMYH
jgi:glycosyltransferase involved in cell wall biosynthesis